MGKERFIELLTKNFINELLPEEAIEFRWLIANNPVYAKQFELFSAYWSEKDLEHARDQAMFKKISSRISEYDETFSSPLAEPLSSSVPGYARYWKLAAAVLVIAGVILYKACLN